MGKEKRDSMGWKLALCVVLSIALGQVAVAENIAVGPNKQLGTVNFQGYLYGAVRSIYYKLPRYQIPIQTTAPNMQDLQFPKPKKVPFTVIVYSINKQGEVLSSRIEQSSGREASDKVAMSVIRSTAPFDPLPSMSPEQVSFRAYLVVAPAGRFARLEVLPITQPLAGRVESSTRANSPLEGDITKHVGQVGANYGVASPIQQQTPSSGQLPVPLLGGQSAAQTETGNYSPDNLPFKAIRPSMAQRSPASLERRWIVNVTPMPNGSPGLFGGRRDLKVNFGFQEAFTDGQAEAWDQWFRRLMHMIYANLQCFPGKSNEPGNDVQIYIRDDGMVKVSFSGFKSDNDVAFEKSVAALNGMSTLRFPTQIHGDTVSINCAVRYGEPLPAAQDLWGRQSGTQWQYSW